MREKDMQTTFGKYLLYNPPQETAAYELKMCKGTSIRFDSLKPHQITALQKAKKSFLYHKITDQPWLPDRPYVFTLKKPFDCFCLVGVKAYVVVWFYKPRVRPRLFIKIDIDKYLALRDGSDRKSYTEKMALSVGEVINIDRVMVKTL